MMNALVAWFTLVAGGDVTDRVLEIVGRLTQDGTTGGAPAPAPGVDATPELGAGIALASVAMTAAVAAGTRHITRRNVLDHETRQEMFEYIWEAGAVHLRQMAQTLDLSTTNATWHLDKLVDADLIGEVKVNGYRMYYPKGAGRLLREQCLVAGQIQSENARAILDYVSENPGSHQREIARALDVNHGTARWHLSRLEEADLLESRPEGRTTTYRLTGRAERVLTDLPPRQLQEGIPLT
jgi:predicted transcriptional regulator